MNTDSTSDSLYEIFRAIPDPRHRRGTIYPLASVLTLCATAMLCGRAASRPSPNGAAITTTWPRPWASPA